MTDSRTVIEKLKPQFSRYGAPEIVMSESLQILQVTGTHLGQRLLLVKIFY